LLKQPQFSPLTVGQQVITVMSCSSGLIDTVPVGTVSVLITDFLASLARDNATLVDEIDETGLMSDESSQKITDALKLFIEKGDYGTTD
jgi:F-type H+-transporting ATPase subunit alpha